MEWILASERLPEIEYRNNVVEPLRRCCGESKDVCAVIALYRSGKFIKQKIATGKIYSTYENEGNYSYSIFYYLDFGEYSEDDEGYFAFLTEDKAKEFQDDEYWIVWYWSHLPDIPKIPDSYIPNKLPDNRPSLPDIEGWTKVGEF